MPPAIHLIPALPAALVIARYRDGEVLVDADQPWRRILTLSRPLLPHRERLALFHALVA